MTPGAIKPRCSPALKSKVIVKIKLRNVRLIFNTRL